MIWTEVLIALIIALALAAVFVPLLGWRRPGAADDEATLAFLFFFLVVFLATLAGGVWLTPMGPTAWGVAWLTFFIVGVMVAFLIAAVAPPRRPRRRRAPPDTEAAVKRVEYSSLFIGALLLLLVLAVAAAYSFNETRWQPDEERVIEQVNIGA